MSGVSTAGSLAKDHGLSFPPEIINEIIANLGWNEMKYTELAFTWCATRRVSKQFFSEITRKFGQKVLPEMTVSYFLGMYPQGKDGACPPHEIYTTEADTQRDRCKGLSIGSINMSLKFDHSSEDGVVAFFNAYRLGSEASPRTGPHKDHQINFFRTLELCRTAEPDFAKGLRQLIHLRGVFQDMALPCFAVDKEKLEMGFNWKDLFSAMFKEEMQVDSAIDIHDKVLSGKIERQRDQRRYLLRWRRFEDWVDRSIFNFPDWTNSAGRYSLEVERTRTIYSRNFAAKASWVGENLGLRVDHGYYERLHLFRDHMDPEDRDQGTVEQCAQ